MTTDLVEKTAETDIEWTREKIELLKRTVCKTATDDELSLFMHLCGRYGLDPFAREIWFVKYAHGVPSIFTSRDGYLKIAHASGVFDGMCSKTTDDESGKPISATAEVWRKDMSHSFVATAKFCEYEQRSPTWSKFPSAMILKVAESMALKRAFGSTCSGLVSCHELPDEIVDGGRREPYLAPKAAPAVAPVVESVAEPVTEPARPTPRKRGALDRTELTKLLVGRGLHPDDADYRITEWLTALGTQRPSAKDRKTFASKIEAGDYDPLAGEDSTPAPVPSGREFSCDHATWGVLCGALAEKLGIERLPADRKLAAWFTAQGVTATDLSLSELNKLYSASITAIDDGTIQ